MKKFFVVLSVTLYISSLIASCAKKTLSLNEETSMKTLLNAKDSEITELVMNEAYEKANIPAERIEIEYILRDKENQAIIVKSKIKDK